MKAIISISSDKTMKITKFFFLLLLIIPLRSSSQNVFDHDKAAFVPIDTFFINNSDEWHIKNGATIFRKLSKIKIGPFKIINSEKKEYRISKHKERSLDLGKGIFKTTTTIDSTIKVLTVLYNSTDSIFIERHLRTVSENKDQILQFGTKEQPNESQSNTDLEQIIIRTNSDTSTWHIMWGFGSLENTAQTDRFEIEKANGFKIGKKRKRDVFGVTTGFMFTHDGKQLALVETHPEMYIWMRKDLTEAHRLVLGGAIIAMLVPRLTHN